MSESTPFKYDYESDEAPRDGYESKHTRRFISKFGLHVLLLLSLIGNIISLSLVVFLIYGKHSGQYTTDTVETPASPLVPPHIDDEVLMPVRFGSDYYAETVDRMEEVDRNWDAINIDVGVISIDREEMAKWGLTPGEDDPSDHNRGVHALRGYHSLHCLKVVRHTMMQLVEGVPLDMTIGHNMHCLAGLLQDAVCYADDSMPLSAPAGEEGVHFVRKCRNWAAMSQWVGHRTSCMATGRNGILDFVRQDFENCTRSDGVLLSGLRMNPSN
ncbi:hypothetical protein GGR51DRAFT_554355 [Nemania sp. FL0031]|nr:hypothetical protein GGR51DRAFT_554355 [Nemania sp. FL0031]